MIYFHRCSIMSKAPKSSIAGAGYNRNSDHALNEIRSGAMSNIPLQSCFRPSPCADSRIAVSSYCTFLFQSGVKAMLNSLTNNAYQLIIWRGCIYTVPQPPVLVARGKCRGCTRIARQKVGRVAEPNPTCKWKPAVKETISSLVLLRWGGRRICVVVAELTGRVLLFTSEHHPSNCYVKIMTTRLE